MNNIPAIVISLSALVFTIASWWWLNARPGKLIATPPQQYGVSMLQGFLTLRIPIVLFNNGALPVVVQNFRLRLVNEDTKPLVWFSSCDAMFSKTYAKNFPKPIVVKGRDAKEIIFEFMGKSEKLQPETSVSVQLECLFSGQDSWKVLLNFNLPIPWKELTPMLVSRHFTGNEIIQEVSIPFS